MPSSNIAVITINGVATSTALVQLSAQASQITIGLQSSQYQCAMGSTFTVTAQQVPLTLASFSTNGYLKDDSILSSFDTIDFTAIPTSVYASCNATFEGHIYPCGVLTSIPLSTTSQSLDITLSVLTDQPPMYSDVEYTATYEECELTQFDFEIASLYNCTASSVSDSSSNHTKCIATTSAGDAASFVWSTANCSNAQLQVFTDNHWVKSDDNVTLKTGVNSYQIVFSTYSDTQQVATLALADVAYTDVDTTVNQASTIPNWSSSVQSYQVSVPCLSFSVSAEISNGTGYEVLVGGVNSENTFYFQTSEFNIHLSTSDSSWPVLDYDFSVTSDLPSLVSVTSSPGGSNIGFNPNVVQYQVVTAYDYIDITTSASSVGQVVINGNIVTGKTNITLSSNGVTYVDMQLQSSQFGCPIQGYSFEITQVSTQLTNYATTGYTMPAWSPETNTFTVASTWTTESISFEPVSWNVDCVLNFNGANYSCNSNALDAVAISSTNQTASVMLFAEYDEPQLVNTYTFALQQQICEIESLTLQIATTAINCTTTKNPSMSTFCVSSTLATTSTIDYVGNAFCKVGAVEYLNGSAQWTQCQDDICPLSSGLNQYQVSVGNPINATTPPQIGLLSVANADVVLTIGNGVYDSVTNVVTTPCQSFTANVSTPAGFTVTLVGSNQGTYSSDISSFTYNVVYTNNTSVTLSFGANVGFEYLYPTALSTTPGGLNLNWSLNKTAYSVETGSTFIIVNTSPAAGSATVINGVQSNSTKVSLSTSLNTNISVGVVSTVYNCPTTTSYTLSVGQGIFSYFSLSEQN